MDSVATTNAPTVKPVMGMPVYGSHEGGGSITGELVSFTPTTARVRLDRHKAGDIVEIAANDVLAIIDFDATA